MGCAAPSGERLLLLLQLPDPLLSSLPAFLGSAMQLLSCNACAVMVNTCLVHWGGGRDCSGHLTRRAGGQTAKATAA